MTEEENMSDEACNSNVSTGKIQDNAQITDKDTGWSEEEKERMRTHGYDSLDIVRAWYS